MSSLLYLWQTESREQLLTLQIADCKPHSHADITDILNLIRSVQSLKQTKLNDQMVQHLTWGVSFLYLL